MFIEDRNELTLFNNCLNVLEIMVNKRNSVYTNICLLCNKYFLSHHDRVSHSGIFCCDLGQLFTFTGSMKHVGRFDINMLSYQDMTSHCKIRQSRDHLLFIIELPIPGKIVFVLNRFSDTPNTAPLAQTLQTSWITSYII